MKTQTEIVETQSPKPTIEGLNALLEQIDADLEKTCTDRNSLNEKIEKIKSDRAGIVKQIIEAHKEKVKALSSEVRAPRSDKGVARKPAEAKV